MPASAENFVSDAEPDVVQNARRQIVSAACRDPRGRALMKVWLMEGAVGEVTAERLEALSYKGGANEYRAECLASAKLCDSITSLARTATFRIDSIVLPTKGVAEQLDLDRARLGKSVGRVLTGNQRWIEIAQLLRQKPGAAPDFLQAEIDELLRPAVTAPPAPAKLLIARGGEFTLDTPLDQLDVMVGKMPEILAGCTRAGFLTGRDIVNMLVHDFEMMPNNARRQMRDFLVADIMLPPAAPGQPAAKWGLKLVPVRIASRVGVPLREAFARFDVPEQAYAILPKPAIRSSIPLTQYEVLQTGMSKLAQALEDERIHTRRDLEKAIIKLGTHPSNASAKLGGLLGGMVFTDKKHAEFTTTAKRVSVAAGLTPEIAFDGFVSPSAAGTDRPAMTLLSRTLVTSPPLAKNQFLLKQDPKFLRGLRQHGFLHEANVEALLVAGGASVEDARKRTRALLGGNVLDPVTLGATPDATRLAGAAGLDPWTAYRKKLREMFESATTPQAPKRKTEADGPW